MVPAEVWRPAGDAQAELDLVRLRFSAEPWFTKVAIMGRATSEIARGQTNVSYSSRALISPTNPPTLRPTHYPPTHSPTWLLLVRAKHCRG